MTEVVGQQLALNKCKAAITAGKNIILVGFSGMGKSYIATKMLEIFGGQRSYELGPPMELMEDESGLESLFSFGKKRRSGVLIVDEIHTHGRAQKEWPLFLDNYSNPVIFTTTDFSDVYDAIKTRSVTVELQEYTQKQLMQITGIKNQKIAAVLAYAARGIPRVAKNIGDMWKVMKKEITFEDFAKNYLGLKKKWCLVLTENEIRYIEFLYQSDKHSAGKTTLLQFLRIQNIEELEWGLMTMGLIEKTRSGRKLSQKAEQVLYDNWTNYL